MTDQPTKKIPAPVYAAAAVGDLAYQRLRKVPDAVSRLRARASTTELDRDRLREAARRNAAAVVAGAKAAGQRASVIYQDLAAHGEQVVRRRQRPATGTPGEAPAIEPAEQGPVTQE